MRIGKVKKVVVQPDAIPVKLPKVKRIESIPVINWPVAPKEPAILIPERKVR